MSPFASLRCLRRRDLMEANDRMWFFWRTSKQSAKSASRWLHQLPQKQQVSQFLSGLDDLSPNTIYNCLVKLQAQHAGKLLPSNVQSILLVFIAVHAVQGSMYIKKLLIRNEVHFAMGCLSRGCLMP